MQPEASRRRVALYQPIFQRVVADYCETPTGLKRVHGLFQPMSEVFQLAVDNHPYRLEGPGRRVYPSSAPAT